MKALDKLAIYLLIIIIGGLGVINVVYVVKIINNYAIVSCGMRYQDLPNGKIVYQIFNIRNNGKETKPVYSGIATKEDVDVLYNWYEKEMFEKVWRKL